MDTPIFTIRQTIYAATIALAIGGYLLGINHGAKKAAEQLHETIAKQEAEIAKLKRLR